MCHGAASEAPINQNMIQYDTGFALSGGFIRGFAHLGIMQALLEHDIRPDILSGVSAGAIAGVFVADGNDPWQAFEKFNGITFSDLTAFSLDRQGLLKMDGFVDFLRSNLRARRLEELHIPLIVTATDFDHGCSVHFRDGEIAERVAASCCLPVLFPPRKIDGVYYVDGGVLMNLPVTTLRSQCRRVIALNVSPMVTDAYKKNMIDIALRVYNYVFQANAIFQKEACDLLIEPDGLDGYSNRDLSKAREIFDRGYVAAQAVLETADD